MKHDGYARRTVQAARGRGPHGGRAAAAVLCLLVVTGIAAILAVGALAQSRPETTISRFERLDPVEQLFVEPGTAAADLALPGALRAVVGLPEGCDPSAFVQEAPTPTADADGSESYDYWWNGYVAPKGAPELYASGQRAVYSIYYAARDEAGDPTSEVGEVAHRVYGTLAGVAGGTPCWFACGEDGVPTGTVADVPVAWGSADYAPGADGAYTFTASFSGYDYAGARPWATVTVEEQGDASAEDAHEGAADAEAAGGTADADDAAELHCSCGAGDGAGRYGHAEGCPLYARPAEGCTCAEDGGPIDADNFPWAHAESCPCFSPVECMCRDTIQVELSDPETGETTMVDSIGDLSHVHDAENRDCPLYGRDTVEAVKADGSRTVMAADDANRIVEAQAKGETPYPALGAITVVEGSLREGHAYDVQAELLSINGGGVNDVATDNYMTTYTPTSGNASYVSYHVNCPGTWKDYLNTIWMNKAYNEFAWTPRASAGAYSGWAWGGGTATQATGTVTTNRLRIPVKSGTTWTVYSGEQLRYALTNYATNDTVRLGGNINLNGNAYGWSTVSTQSKELKLNGGGYNICNLGLTDTSSRAALVDPSPGGGSVVNINFVTCKGCAGGSVGLLGSTQARTFLNINVRDSLMYSCGGGVSFLLMSGTNPAAYASSPDVHGGTLQRVSVTGSYVYGTEHVAPIASFLGGQTVRFCSTSDNLVVSNGGHSGGFVSCFNNSGTYLDCYTSGNELYAHALSGGFSGYPGDGGIFERCWASGKLEGYSVCGGFAGRANIGHDISGYANGANMRNYQTFTDCYSTMLVGMRSASSICGGFVGQVFYSPNTYPHGPNVFVRCWAAGEVGNFSMNFVSNTEKHGGFIGEDRGVGAYVTRYRRCYYDKQTTAMREWVTGSAKSCTGIAGLLTTTTAKGGTGMASGADFGLGTAGWTYEAGRYPQLSVFANATAADWGSAAAASKAQACSLASTSTVFLDTWDEGYDWDANGVRSGGEVSYDRTLASTGKADHAGYEHTYDTVREIVSDFEVTPGTGWSELVSGTDVGGKTEGAIVDVGGTKTRDTVAISGTTSKGEVHNPGMDWYSTSAGAGGQTGHRPLRLIAYMEVDAGADQSLSPGQAYDHRTGLRLTMMDDVADDMVVGLDDDEAWSTAKVGGYPASDKYWAVPTANMDGTMTAGRGAWLYTEIWRAQQNADGTFVSGGGSGLGSEDLVPDLSAKVTGAGTGSNLTLSEQRWNGDIPMYEDISVTRKYLVTYYWMLEDGRYRADTKTVTMVPGEYGYEVSVEGEDGSANDATLHLGLAQDSGANTAYAYGASTADSASLAGVPYTKNAAVAWKKAAASTVVAKLQVTFTSRDGTVMGTATLEPSSLVGVVAGDAITVPTTYRYNSYVWDAVQNANREVTVDEVLDVVYDIEDDGAGGLRLRFNKLANPPADEIASATAHGTAAGLPAGLQAYVNETCYDTAVVLTVRMGLPFSFTKTDEDGDPLAGTTFEVYRCTKAAEAGHVHSELANGEAGCCWDVASPVYSVTTDATGLVSFPLLPTGDYQMAETATADGYQLPQGQWLISVDNAAGTVDIEARGQMPPGFRTEADPGTGAVSYYLPNYRQLAMPSTGGGALALTVCGVALVGVAGALEARRRARR